MRIFNRYLLILTVAAAVCNITMAAMGQKDITVYFTVNILAYLVITVLHAYLNPKARRSLNAISVVLFGGFLLIVLLRVLEIFSGSAPK